jgi:hypothetical protein
LGKLNNITVTEDQLFWMFRYCLSRRTYAASDGADAIVTNWKLLSKNTKDLIVKEINEVLTSEFVSDMMDTCDKETWKRVLALDYDEKSKEGNSHE